MSRVSIRPAVRDDAEAVRDIYAPIVADTTISFESDPPHVDTMAERIAATEASHAWLVAERAGHLAGYAYGGPHRARHAYRYSTEVSVYVHTDHRGAGVGLALYAALFDALAARGYFHAYAGITQPNHPSSRLHAAAGFSKVGTFPRVGYKFGAWHDVDWWYRPLQNGHPEGDPA